MEAALAPAAPAQRDFRAELHELIDQIQDAEMLRVVWKLLAPQVPAASPAEEPEEQLSPAWQQELTRRLAVADTQAEAGQGLPWREVIDRLMNQKAA